MESEVRNAARLCVWRESCEAVQAGFRALAFTLSEMESDYFEQRSDMTYLCFNRIPPAVVLERDERRQG